MSQSKNWCFTLNNYTEEDVAAVEKLMEQADYLICGKEVGEQGTPHLQGYVQLKKRLRLTGLKKILPRAHLQVARGSAQENKTYCSKDGDYKEYGQIKETDPGKREKRRWDEILQKAKEGRIDEIDPQTTVQHYNALKRIKKDYMKKPDNLNDVCGIWVYGETGAGKTTWARKNYPDAFIKTPDKWWDGYQGEEYVILDDLDKYHVSLGYHVKMWGDKWSFKAEDKGGVMWIRPKKFIITSQYMPHDIWDDAKTVSAINRRFEIKKL